MSHMATKLDGKDSGSHARKGASKSLRRGRSKSKTHLTPIANKPHKITRMQRDFIAGYIEHGNGTRAARDAGSKQPRRMASRWLTKAHIRAEIDRANQRAAEKLDLTAEKVLRELSLLGFSNMGNYMTEDPNGDPQFVQLSELTEEQKAALCEITVDYYTEGSGRNKQGCKRVKFKLADKRGPLTDLAKIMGMMDNRGQVDVVVQSLPGTVEQAEEQRQRLDEHIKRLRGTEEALEADVLEAHFAGE